VNQSLIVWLATHRFYIKCTLCSAEITFKTDPKNTDYEAEHGAQRNFEPWREESNAVEIDRLTKLEEEENNPMKALENRTVDSKREMDVLDALQDIRARNARNEKVGSGDLNELMERRLALEVENEVDEQKRLEEEEDERLVREVFSKLPVTLTPEASTSSSAPNTPATSVDPEASPSPAIPTITVKRKADSQKPDLATLLAGDSPLSVTAPKTSMPPPAKKRKADLASSLGIKLVKGKRKAVA
jgi:hypothetical protein